MSAKVLIVDDHEAARLGISEILKDSGFTATSLAKSGKEAISIVKTEAFDVVVLDVRMPSVDGLKTLEVLRDISSNLPVVVVSAYDNPTYIARAAALGAYDYVLKNGNSNEICESLRRAVDGEAPPSGSRLTSIRNRLSEAMDYRKLPAEFPLTGRESQVLVHVALGLSNKEIARSLAISVETVKEHVQNILRKIKANDRTDAAVRAVRLGIVD